MTGLRNKILGSWELTSFSSRDVDTGVVRYPLGLEPRGLIMYTDNGYVSAQLAGPDLSGCIAYGGRFHIGEQHGDGFPTAPPTGRPSSDAAYIADAVAQQCP